MAEQQVQKQHPIPQQVLGIQFKIVGDLTLRQFVILALFGGLAYALFSLPNVNPLIKIPLAGIVLLIGVAFSLVPVQDQPLDRWLANFFEAIYSPTKRVWQKEPEPPEFLVVPIPKLVRTVEEGVSPEEARQRLEEYLTAIRTKEVLTPLDLAEKQQLEFINLELQTSVTEAPVPPTPAPFLQPPLPKRKYEEARKRPSLASTINYAAEPVFRLQRGEEVTYITTLSNIKVGRRLSYTPTTAEVVFAPAKEKVIAPTIEEVAPPLPRRQAGPQPPPPFKIEPPIPVPPSLERPTPAEIIPTLRPVVTPPPLPPKEVLPPLPPPKPAPPEKLRVKPLPKGLKKVELKPPPPPVGEPNVIAGTVYDEMGGITEGALVAIKDRDGTTIRAVKTNQLGQFTFSPLPNGYYTIELPKAELPFAIMKVGLTGVVVPPLEIRATT